MKLRPSLKDKKRYILFESSVKLSKKDLLHMVQKQFEKCFGMYLGESGVQLLPECVEGNKFIIRCSPKYVKDVVKAMLLITTYKNKEVTVSSVLTTGIIARAKEKLK